MRHLIIYVAIAMLTALDAVAGDFTGKLADHSLTLELRPGWVAPTSSYLKDIYGSGRRISSAVSPNLKYSFRFAPDTREGMLYPSAYQGIGLGYTATFPKTCLGHPVNIYLFQGAHLYSFTDRLSLDYEWNFGLSAGWKKYDEDSNPLNTAIGSSVNAYINLGFLLSYRLSPSWKISVGMEGTHYSDGNTRLPNAGVNLLGGRVGITYTMGSGEPLFRPDTGCEFERGWGYDLLVYGARRQRTVNDGTDIQQIVDVKFGVGGITFAPMYAVNRYLRAGLSLDMQYDESVNLDNCLVDGYYGDDLKFYRQPFSERFSAGLSAHAELTMPVFSINAGIGRNVIAGCDDTRIFYQTLALKARVWHGAFINIGYQIRDFHKPNNLMLGVGYTFGHR